MKILTITALVVASVATSPLCAQQMRLAFPSFDPGVRVAMNEEFSAPGEPRLQMDVYRPPASMPAGRGYPVLVFFNRATGADRSGQFYAGWARMAASRGMVAILPDLRDGKQGEDFRALMAYLDEHATHLGMDHDAIAVYAASGNAYTALPILESPEAKLVKAAVIYYGAGDVKEFRLDLPMLMVRAGLDRPGLNVAMTELASRGVSQNAPITLLNYPTGHHAFEMMDDNDATRDVIEQTLTWVKRAMEPATLLAAQSALPEAEAAGLALSGNFTKAASLYATLVAAAPADSRMRLAWGETLIGAGEFARACTEFEKLRGKGLGPRDVGLPGARACVQAGDPAAAVKWLESIPARFLPAQVANEPAFAPIRDRPDFKAVFARPAS
ncbi:MAG: dienelactone hydrolase family protein [Cytophagaceae bacterium]|nr:dienelactone hydrolase family protein [Gemmatimonadaceae bacterium]